MRKLLKYLLVTIGILVFAEVALFTIGKIYLKKWYATQHIDLREPAENINIVCLGESSTAGLWLHFEDSYPKQLEKKLRQEYGNENINAVVPIHVGQNTSQQKNRIKSYIDFYKPKLFILMVGFNNGWAFAESNIIHFFPTKSFEAFKLKLLVFLDRSRVFKVLKHFYFKTFDVLEDKYFFIRNKHYLLGHPELTYDPPQWIHELMRNNEEALVDLWKSDVGYMLEVLQEKSIPVILMTYHINSLYLSPSHFEGLAKKYTIPLVRNDLTFDALIANKTIQDYLLHDNWHPNKEGYAIIAANAFDKIKELELDVFKT